MIAHEWASWVAENLLRGAPRADVAAVLRGQGLSEAEAEALVAATIADPIFAAAARVAGRAAGLEQAARLRRAHDAAAEYVTDTLDEATFRRVWWDGHRPVVYRGGAAAWPAARWTLGGLAEVVGDVEVSVLRGRSAHPRWWTRREALTTRMPLRELLHLTATTEGDDVYAVGRNDLLDEPGLRPLFDDLGREGRLLPGIEPARPHGRLWVGPRGTLTPLHHDQSSAWLVQLVGTKRVWLASPLEPTLLDTVDGVFNRVDPRETPGEVGWLTVDLAPGDALFLPVGWWHQVLATAPSVSVSLGGFRWPHTMTWYAPGRRHPR